MRLLYLTVALVAFMFGVLVVLAWSYGDLSAGQTLRWMILPLSLIVFATIMRRGAPAPPETGP
jgi:hypothetical protein